MNYREKMLNMTDLVNEEKEQKREREKKLIAKRYIENFEDTDLYTDIKNATLDGKYHLRTVLNDGEVLALSELGFRVRTEGVLCPSSRVILLGGANLICCISWWDDSK